MHKRGLASRAICQIMSHPSAHTGQKRKTCTFSVLFASLCTKDLEPRWPAPWSNSKQSHALSTNNEVTMNHLWNIQNVHCCASSTVVLPSSTLLPYEYTSGKQNTRQIARFRCSKLFCVHWTWNKEELLSDRTVFNFKHYTQETKFSLHKTLICPECAQLSLFSSSLKETCAEWFLQHYSVAFCWAYIPGGKTKQK